MKLSVIIVNYNVQYFLSSCLQAALEAAKRTSAEIIVVDNLSSDGSVEMVRNEFPQVTLIANQENRGFSRANNQGMAIAKGEYMLLLNPDTIVEEDCFVKCVEYMDQNADCGGLGVHMIDGGGKFLPESKRGLPTPEVAFYKIFGLAKLFPKSKRFGAYHLGYLDKNKSHSVDVLSGAFMMLRKSLIDQIGGLDEAFFMYGEDIDLSYRITKAGFKNIYFSDASIIHFKGESTKKSSVNYVLVFYRAMIIFANKHFSFPNARLLGFLINAAIYLRASLAIFERFARFIYMPIIDAGIFWIFLEAIKRVYEYKIVQVVGYFPEMVKTVAFPVMIVIWVLGQLVSGGYRQPVQRIDILKGLSWSAVTLIFLYAMSDESLRFSRAIVGLAVVGSFIVLPISRILLQFLGLFKLDKTSEQRIAIIGSPEEVKRISKLLTESIERPKKLYFINPLEKSNQTTESDTNYLASLNQLKDAIDIYRLNEVVFSMKDIRSEQLIDEMQRPYLQKVNIFLSPPVGNYLLRSSSNKDLGEYIIPEENPQMSKWSKRKKRVLEIMIASVLLLLSPLLLFLYRRPVRFLKNMLDVIKGNVYLIGLKDWQSEKRVLIDPFSTMNNSGEKFRNPFMTEYLIHYSVRKDLSFFLGGLTELDL